MNWRDLLPWRQQPIADAKALADFIDTQAAFLIQKGMHEYARARAGHYAKVLFSEQEFLDALDRSRWSAFPLGLNMVGELAEGILRPHAQGQEARHLAGLTSLVLSIFDRYPTPAQLSDQEWRDARSELARRLLEVGLHQPKRAKDIPEPYARTYWDLMPIKKEIRSADYPTTRSYLMVMLCNIHDRLSARIDAPSVARQLIEASPTASAASPLAGSETS